MRTHLLHQYDMSMDDRALFLKLAEHGSYAATARRLGVARSTIMRRIERLEAELDTTLVHRAGRSVVLTTAGHRLADGLRGVFRSLHRVEQEVRSDAGRASGTVRVWLPNLGTGIGIVESFAAFAKAHPEIELRIDLAKDPRKHKAGDFDGMLQMSRRFNPELQSVTLFHDRLILVASPEYLEEHGTLRSLNDAEDHVCIEQRDGSGRVLPWRMPDGSKVVSPRTAVSTQSNGYVYEFALCGVGIGRVSEALALPALEDGRLVQVLPEVSLEEPLIMVYLPDPSPATRALLVFLKTYWSKKKRTRRG